jgi:hypothetical protein
VIPDRQRRRVALEELLPLRRAFPDGQEGALDGLDVVQPPAEVVVVERTWMRFERAPVDRVRPLLVLEEARQMLALARKTYRRFRSLSE